MTTNKNYLKKTLQLVLPLLLGLFLCWYAFAQFSTEELALIKEQFLRADYSYLWLSVGMGFLSHVSRGLRWQYTLASMHYFPKRYNLVLAVFVGYLLNLTIPRSGEVSRALLINRYDKVPFDKSFGTILTERAIDMCILLLLIAIVFVFQFDLVWHFLESYFTSPKGVLEYICETGLAGVFKNKEISNLVDYVFGIEVGLDTNARKNRGGDNMSKAVSLLFDKEGIFYKKEVSSTLFLDIESNTHTQIESPKRELHQ